MCHTPLRASFGDDIPRMSRGLFWIGVSTFGPHWTVGFRFGEAQNPGPVRLQDASVVTFAVINPTTILDKEWQVNQVGADVLVASETSANARVQGIMSFKFRGLGYRCMWGHPTETRFHAGSGKAMLRSYAQGVAALSKLPCRPALHCLPPAMLHSCRISECFVRLHGFEIKVISVYGVPRCLPEAAEKNNLLLAWAFQRATVSAVPALVAGDFNTEPTALPAWQAFQDLGWGELGAFVAQTHDVHLPFTCKGATRFDTFLLPPSLLQYFHSAEVLDQAHLFDSHAPMLLRLHLPRRSLPRWIWRQPRPFSELLDNPSDLEKAYSTASRAVRPALDPAVPEVQPGDKLQLWSAVVETSVSEVLWSSHKAQPELQPLKGLPRRYRGRCKAAERKQASPPMLPRAGRHGDPEAFDEDTSVLGRQRLRQWRRLRTYEQGLRKFLDGRFRGPLDCSGWPTSLHLEWQAIQNAPGYNGRFYDWVLQWPCFLDFPLQRPSLTFVTDLTSFVRFDVEALQRQSVATKARLFKFQLHVDAKEFGAGRSFVRVRPAQNPPFTCVQTQVEQAARLCQRHAFHHCTFAVNDEALYELHSTVYYAQVPGQVSCLKPGRVTVVFDAADDCVLPSSAKLARYQQDSSWRGIVGSLMTFWSPIWNRDSRQQEEDIEAWPQFQHLLRTCLSPCRDAKVDMLDVSAWCHVARKLSVRKASGACGWHNSELRVLPREALADLAVIVQGLLPHGFPADILKARVAVLSKVALPTQASQARPITVLSCIFRLWARVLCTQVLASWSLQLPPAITGCLKGRSAVDLAYAVQAEVETCLLQAEDLSGLSLDLRKAFNYLPRAPICHLLGVLGVPSTVCTFWHRSLARVQRSFQIHQSLGPELASSTGAPEGDPVSVLAMIAVCWMFVSLLQGVVQPRAYVDNWSWNSDAPDNHGPALLLLQDLVSSLQMQVDWGKTYVWGLTSASRDWWRQIGPAFLPQGVHLELVDHVKELGSFFSFGRRGCGAAFGQRGKEALGRLSKLATDPQGLPVRARVVQCGVWPFLFYGTEACLPSVSVIAGLRSAAARAIVGEHKTLSPWAALCFTPGVQDPEVFLLCHHLSQLRRSFRVAPALAEAIWRNVLEAEVSARSVCGPAGALKHLLARNGWTCSATGRCRGPLHVAFDVHSSPIKEIRKAVETAWANTVHDNFLHRNGLLFAPLPSPDLSCRVFSSFRPWEQKVLARHYSGGFMSGAERNTWSREDTEFCPLCNAVDSKAHRLYHCPALAEPRRAHQDTLQWVREQRPHWTHMAYVAWPEAASVLQLLLQQLRLPALAPPFSSATSLCLFTDASALHTQNTLARLTAWAVVSACRPGEAPELSPWRLESAHLLSTFTVLAQGTTPGLQTVPRAELAAIVWACDWAAQMPLAAVELYSDCQSAVDLWTDWSLFGWDRVAHRSNADLLRPLRPCLNVKVFKVKAHRTEVELAQLCLWDKWLSAGNEAADAAAKAACHDIPEVVRSTAAAVAHQSDSERYRLHSFCKAILDLGPVEVQLRSAARTRATQDSDDFSQLSLVDFLAGIRQWSVPSGCSSLPDTWEEDWSGWPYGSQYGSKLLEWLGALRWPPLPVEPQMDHQVSYLELLLSFMTYAEYAPWIEDRACPGQFLQITAASSVLRHWSLRMVVECFRATLKQLSTQLHCNLLPFPEAADVAYLRIFHLKSPCPGLTGRPQLPGPWADLLKNLASSEQPAEYLLEICRAFPAA